MFKIGDIVVRDLSSVNLLSSTEHRAVGRIVSNINSRDCYTVEITDPNGCSHFRVGARMWWSVKLMQLAFPKEPDWEV